MEQAYGVDSMSFVEGGKVQMDKVKEIDFSEVSELVGVDDLDGMLADLESILEEYNSSLDSMNGAENGT